MVFSSYEFMWIFLPVVVAVYYLLCKTRLAQLPLAFLVLASLFYYAFWDFDYLAVILCSILGNYWVGRKIQGSLTRKRALTIFGVCANVAALGYYKYTGFVLETFNQLAGAQIRFPAIALPIGISFFTFQQIAFLVDCYKEKVQEKSFLSYCLFVCFFPQLVAGPIVHHSEMMPQFASKEVRIFNPLNFYRGMTLL
ncbi:MAG: MBOAT family protein, partial [Holosporales bacterium]|nr:MBOAT family protein [Holosporales bacterium]